MQPEVLVQLIQLGAMGLLGVVLYFVMQQQFKLIEMLAGTLKEVIQINASLQTAMLQALLDAKDESVVMAKAMSIATAPPPNNPHPTNQ